MANTILVPLLLPRSSLVRSYIRYSLSILLIDSTLSALAVNMCATSLLLSLYLLTAHQCLAAPDDVTLIFTPTPETPTTATPTTLDSTSDITQSDPLSVLSQSPTSVSQISTTSSILVTKLGININRVKDHIKNTKKDDYDSGKKNKVRTILRNQNVEIFPKDKRGKQKIKPLDYILGKPEKMKPKTRTFGALFALAALTGINPLANPFQFISPGHNTLHIITVYRRRFPFFVDPVYYYDTNYAYYDDYGNYNYNNNNNNNNNNGGSVIA